MQQNATREMLVAMLAERLDRPEHDFELQTFTWALIGVLQSVILTWVDSEGELDLPGLLDRGLDYLEAGCPL
jgi:hypothetical protein